MKIIIENSKNGPYFRVVAGNGKEIVSSNAYASKRNLADSLATLKAGLPEAEVVDKA